MNAGVAVVGAVLMRRSKVGLGKLFEEQVVRGWPGRNARATGLGWCRAGMPGVRFGGPWVLS